MVERTYPSGVPCWIDIEPLDADAAREFYGALFGWTFSNMMPPDAPGYYFIAQLDDQVVGAIASPEPVSTGGWNTYIAVDDTDAATAGAEAAGGQGDECTAGCRSALGSCRPMGRDHRPDRSAVPPLAGRSTPWRTSGQCAGRVELQRSPHRGSRDRAARSTSRCSDGSLTRSGAGRRCGVDPVTASTWRPPPIRTSSNGRNEASAPPGFEDAIAWLAPLQDHEEPHWHVTFAVADRDDAVATAEKLGAELVTAPQDDEWTKSAVVRDPQGACSLSASSPPPHRCTDCGQRSFRVGGEPWRNR